METVQGYVILKAATFETGHGFALGHNPGAPSPFVTWQFTEGENGHRDYYWGRYGTSQAWAQRDFDRRVDDYQQFYHAAVKHTELGPEGVYRYYSTQRPVDIGTYPKPPDNQPLSIVNYDDDRRRPVADGRLMAWGELTYAKPLTEKQMEDYELKPAPGNPDRVRPSITARGASSLLLRRLQGRRKPSEKPGTHEENAGEKAGRLLRFAASKGLTFRAFLRVFPGWEYLITFLPGLPSYFVTSSTSGHVGPRHRKEESLGDSTRICDFESCHL